MAVANEKEDAVGNGHGFVGGIEPDTEAISGVGERAAESGGDAVCRLLHALLGSLRFDETLLIEETPAEPGEGGDGNEGECE